MNIISGKENCMKQLDQWADKIRAQINLKYDEIQLEINRYHRKIEASRDHWKTSLTRTVETEVKCPLEKQSHKNEVEEIEFNRGRTEFESSKKLFLLLHEKPIICLTSAPGNQDVLNAPCLVLPNIITDSFGWIEESSMEDRVSAMEHSHQQQTDIDEYLPYRIDNGEYNLDSQQQDILYKVS